MLDFLIWKLSFVLPCFAPGYDLLGMTLNGPQSSLDLTRHCQPAVVVASLAAVEGLNAKDPHLVRDAKKVAGFSVGEITALIFSGVLSLEDGMAFSYPILP